MTARAGVLLDGAWLSDGPTAEVTSPYDGSVVAEVSLASAEQVQAAIGVADHALRTVPFPQWQRAEALDRAAAALRERHETFAATIAAEAGKPLAQARVEAARAADTLSFSAAAARTLAGEAIPMDASASGAGRLALTLRRPIGVVGAITPFNFPLNLAAHKLGPALAGGNPVLLKPALQTPLVAIGLVELLLEAGVPAGYLQLLTGRGAETGAALVADERVAAISFTGSREVGWRIRAQAPRKKVLLELGSTSPLIVHDDGDWEVAAEKAAIHGFSFAGQSCISVQRVLVHEAVAEPFVERLVRDVGQLRVGDPLDPATQVGPLIDEANAERVVSWVQEAAGDGASLLAGGARNPDGTVQPTVLATPHADYAVWRQEVFGPVVAVRTYGDLDEAIALANDADYGLQAGVFTRSLATALTAADRLEFGGVLVNEVPTFRADQQPYGGVKDSGNTREGPSYTIHELTEPRLVSFQGLGA